MTVGSACESALQDIQAGIIVERAMDHQGFSVIECLSECVEFYPGVFYQSDRPTKNGLEKRWIDQTREKVGQATELELPQKTFSFSLPNSHFLREGV